jgi:hypothetical protein
MASGASDAAVISSSGTAWARFMSVLPVVVMLVF